MDKEFPCIFFLFLAYILKTILYFGYNPRRMSCGLGLISIFHWSRSPVLSVNVLDNAHQSLKRSIPLTKPIEFVIQHKSIKRVRKRKCTYWEFKHAKWSSDGCYTIRKRSSSTTTACQCYHLTNFAIAVELEQGIVSEKSKECFLRSIMIYHQTALDNPIENLNRAL